MKRSIPINQKTLQAYERQNAVLEAMDTECVSNNKASESPIYSEEKSGFFTEAELKKMQENLGGYSAVLGEMAQESKQRKRVYKDVGCIAGLKNGRYVGRVIGFWTLQDILKYIVRYNIPLFKLYGEVIDEVLEDGSENFYLTGCQRTGCKLCLFGCQYKKNTIHQLKYLEPHTWKILLKPIEEGGYGYGEVIKYLNENCGTKIEL